MIDYSKLNGIEQLRMAVNVLDNCNESFNLRHSAQDLLKLVEMQLQCEWDITPDCWEDFQVEAALKGVVPEFRHFMKEDYSTSEHYRCGSQGMVPIFPEGFHSELSYDDDERADPEHCEACSQ